MSKLSDGIERLIFGVTAQGRVDMLVELAARRAEARIVAALALPDATRQCEPCHGEGYVLANGGPGETVCTACGGTGVREGADRETERERASDMAALTQETREHIQTLKGLKHTGAFSQRAYGRLYRAMLAGEDAYAYTSLDGRIYAWHAGRRYTASAYNALAYADEVGRSFPIVLWRLMTPGFSYPDGRTWETFTDADGREWETFDDSERVTCSLCGAGITHGYRTPASVSEPARQVCASHVAAHAGEGIGEPDGA